MHRSRVGPLGREPLEHAPGHPNHPAVLADLDTKQRRLSFDVPTGVLGKGEGHVATGRTAPSGMFSIRSSVELRDAPGCL
jgi:hypothetical protein